MRWQSLLGALLGFAGVIATLMITAEQALDQEQFRDNLEQRASLERSLALSALLTAEVRQKSNTLCAIYARIPVQAENRRSDGCPPESFEVENAENSYVFDVDSLRAWMPMIRSETTLETTVYFANYARIDSLPSGSMAQILNFYAHLSGLRAVLDAAVATFDIEHEQVGVPDRPLSPALMVQLNTAFARLFSARKETLDALSQAGETITQAISALPIPADN